MSLFDSIFLGLKTRVVEQKLGWVVDYCPICQEPCICQLSRFNMIKHWNFIPVGEKTPLEDEIRCSQCRIRQEVTSTRYRASLDKRPTDLASATEATLPDLATRQAARLELDKRVRENYRQLSVEEREFLLFEPFRVLGWHFERTVTNGQLDKQGGIGCIGTLLVGALFIPITIYTPHAQQETVMKIIGGLLAFGLVYTLVQMALSVGRVMRQSMYPNLVRVLNPLRPNKLELQAAHQRCEMLNYRLAKHLKVPKLLAALQ